jgi:hypothetical protein
MFYAINPMASGMALLPGSTPTPIHVVGFDSQINALPLDPDAFAHCLGSITRQREEKLRHPLVSLEIEAIVFKINQGTAVGFGLESREEENISARSYLAARILKDWVVKLATIQSNYTQQQQEQERHAG